ncbi:unnamed protein product, partial [Allacma fusca]
DWETISSKIDVYKSLETEHTLLIDITESRSNSLPSLSIP